jgi:hypothetical protein
MRFSARFAGGLVVVGALAGGRSVPGQGAPEPAKPKPPGPLFTSDSTLVIGLIADFGAIAKDRDTLNPKRYPGVLLVQGTGNHPDSLQVELQTRGHFRRSRLGCDVPPLRVRFPKEGTAGDVFQGQHSLKLTTHCNSKGKDFEQYVLLEFLGYRVYNLLTDLSFRARLARVTYREPNDTAPRAARYGFFIEDDEAMAKRGGGKLEKTKGARFEDLDRENGTLIGVFEYFIGNTDWSVPFLHNIRLVRRDLGTFYAVPYDFDWSGVVDARYAKPDVRLPIKSVRDRLYRGPCRTPQDLEPVLAKFRADREGIYQLYRTLPGLEPDRVKSALRYYDDFYRTIDEPALVKREFGLACG